MKCPNCVNTKLVIAERCGIEIDHCPDCRGIWLDRGELDKILERNRESETPRYSNDFSEERFEKRSDKGYPRKRSFLEDLFD